MHSNLENGAVQEKVLELCSTLVAQPDFAVMRQRIDAFMADDDARRLYHAVAERSEQLQCKQHQGEQLSQEEIDGFETQREALFQNENARLFLDARQQMQTIEQTVSRYVMKTLELGRVPTPDDLSSCGEGCSCH